MGRKIKKTDRHKPWNKRTIGSRSYRVGKRKKAKSFLIICEGENTEPYYFKSFPVGNASVESFGLGKSRTDLMKDILDNFGEEVEEKEVWAVFDLDLDPGQADLIKEDFNIAIELAQHYGVKVAYSVDAFELWFLLHYQDLQAQWDRFDYYKRLSSIWNCNYKKVGKKISFCRKIYSRLKEDPNADQVAARRRCGELALKNSYMPYSERNPSTMVYKLVEELNKYC